jgi:c-di-GMP-binding flagellar brake protein YcgR
MAPRSRERRRGARLARVPSAELMLASSTPVRVLDISLGGALIVMPHDVRVGQRAELRAMLAGQPFSAEVDVRFVHRDTSDLNGLRRVGVMFVFLSHRSETTLRQFLNQKDRPSASAAASR